MNSPQPSRSEYDVIIVGAALSGAGAAILLLQQKPDLRVLLIEKSAAFTRRVGEATVEVSSWYLSRALGLTQHLNESHLVKQGMRFWFANEQTQTLADCSEIGGRYQVRLPAYQVDRAVLDEEVLRRARDLGADVWRPANVQSIQLVAGGEQIVTASDGVNTCKLTARWIVDASGVAAMLAREHGWRRANEDHPTTAVWARWRGVKDWDGLELARKHPEWAAACPGVRGTATNHIVGDGWWSWWIPLKGGDVSVGVVFDQRLVNWPTPTPEVSTGQRLKDFLQQHPAARELLTNAQWIEGDVHWRKNLPYYSTTLAGDGFALVGDAAGFIDPFYSPGMDWIAFTSTATTELILAQQRGEALAPLVERHNRDFTRSYQRWFNAVYRDKYEYLAEFDLMRLAFVLDLGLYYLGIVSQPFKRGLRALKEPVFSTGPSVPVYHVMRTYNRRFASIARARRQRGALRRQNHGERFLFGGYTLEPGSARPVLGALLKWGWLEITEGWRTWFAKNSQSTPVEKPLPAATSMAKAS